jgi:hypothetical protein
VCNLLPKNQEPCKGLFLIYELSHLKSDPPESSTGAVHNPSLTNPSAIGKNAQNAANQGHA